MSLSDTVKKLRERIGPGVVPGRGVVHLGGVELRLGCVHEWFAVQGEGESRGAAAPSPPVCVLLSVVNAALKAGRVAGVFWIGRGVWPYPRVAPGGESDRWALVDAPDVPSRAWAIDVAMRAGVAVVADGRGLTLAHTRRLQLAAGGSGSLCLLARPGWERGVLSAATTRWAVSAKVTTGLRPRWTLAQLRNKDHPARTDEAGGLLLEWDHAQGVVGVPAVVADRPDRASAAAAAG
jgi:hypothetical protein